MSVLVKQQFKGSARCNKCDSNLSQSFWKDIRIIVKVTTGTKTCYCINCGLHSIHRSIMVIPSQLDEFINQNENMKFVKLSEDVILSECELRNNVIRIRRANLRNREVSINV